MKLIFLTVGLLLLVIAARAVFCLLPVSAEIHNEASAICKTLKADEAFRAEFDKKGITINDIKVAAGNCGVILVFYTKDEKAPDAGALDLLSQKVKNRKSISDIEVKFIKGTPAANSRKVYSQSDL